MDSTPEKISTAILVLFFNKVDQTINCIDSFLPSGQKIYVLNNGSDQNQLLKLQDYFVNNNQVHIFDVGSNLGVSGGRNYLIHHTTEPWIFSVDNDIKVQPSNWFQLFTAYIQQFPNRKIIVPKLYNVHEQVYSEQLRIAMQNGQAQIETGLFSVSNCFPGGASLVHRSVFVTCGLFDDEMFVGFEDYEFALRAILNDRGPLEVHTIDTIELIHDHKFQKNSSDKAAVKLRYNESRLQDSYNRLIKKFGVKFNHDWQWWTRSQIQIMTQPKWKIRLKKFIIRIIGILD